MDVVYPKPNAQLFIPRELDGNPGAAVFELAHQNLAATVFWHLDNQYLGSTHRAHKLSVQPEEGKHVLVVTDDSGVSLVRHFTIISKM